MRSSFRPAAADEPVELDFAGVAVIAPAWLDEILTSLREDFGNRVRWLPSDNASLVQSLKTLEAVAAMEASDGDERR